ncbi:hypothetical protein OOK31_25490 [Streptomyces sp. NBC_00249]|uniref:hypothetical protein n=1 Tax=Streptomyces sp. NBC_00249 TaxID=2975690 RepID=UPI0022538BBA|nr:hypothetical protein [Streptomyces sp. NBC_00249]MCX5197211.1 hypothetical protein [Streptomyces sp. NBC_00249]
MNAPTSREWVQAAARRLTTGSERLAAHHVRRTTLWVRTTWARTMEWLSDASGLAWAVRLTVLLAAAWVLRKVGVYVATVGARRLHTSSGLLWPVLALWLIAAWRVGHPDWQPRAAPTAERTPEPAGKPEPVSLAKEQPVGPSLDDVLAAARTLGTPHVHLAAIEEHLGAPAGTARRALTEAGIPIADVRMTGRGTSTGVRGTDIPPLPSPSPEAAVAAVGTGQDANNSNNNGVRVKEEAGMTIIHVPSERRAYKV